MKPFGLLALLAAVQTARGVEISGYVGGACMGENLFDFEESTFNNCRDLTGYRQSDSIVVANFDSGQTAFFYSDNACKNELYSTDSEVCYVEPDDNVGSYSVAEVIG